MGYLCGPVTVNWKRLEKFKIKKEKGEMTIEEVIRSLEGWAAYAKSANTYNLRRKIYTKFNDLFNTGVSLKTDSMFL